jgi:hypothetical protein
MFDPITLLAALGPLVVEAGKATIQKYIATDTYKPTSVDEVVKLKQLELDTFKAVNEAGGTNPSYPWVEAIIRLQRPFVVVGVIGTWAACKFFDIQCGMEVENFAAAVGFYLFGDRSLFYAKKITQ